VTPVDGDLLRTLSDRWALPADPDRCVPGRLCLDGGDDWCAETRRIGEACDECFVDTAYSCSTLPPAAFVATVATFRVPWTPL
jgi:hypothetical protein